MISIERFTYSVKKYYILWGVGVLLFLYIFFLFVTFVYASENSMKEKGGGALSHGLFKPNPPNFSLLTISSFEVRPSKTTTLYCFNNLNVHMWRYANDNLSAIKL